MSVFPSTSTPCWAQTLAVVRAWTASTSPACTVVIAWGERMEWKIWRAMRGGTLDNAFEVAAKEARSRRDHSHSRFWRKEKFDGKVSLLSVVSIWKIFTPDSAMRRPMRQLAEWSSEAGWSMKLFECCMVGGLWWGRRLRVVANPGATLLWPPSMETRLMLTYTSRSEVAARLLSSTSSP